MFDIQIKGERIQSEFCEEIWEWINRDLVRTQKVTKEDLQQEGFGIVNVLAGTPAEWRTGHDLSRYDGQNEDSAIALLGDNPEQLLAWYIYCHIEAEIMDRDYYESQL